MQQINLYLPEFQSNREPMRAMHIAVGVILVVFLLCVFSLLSYLEVSRLSGQIITAQKEQDEWQKKMLQMAGKKSTVNDLDLSVKIEKLQKELQRRQQILDMISHQNLGNEKGFSAQLKAIAEASLPTVSVETFSLQKGGNYAEFSGKTTAADQIPLYVRRLHTNASFAQVGVGVLSVERDEKNPTFLQFSLSRAEIEKSDAAKSGGQ